MIHWLGIVRIGSILFKFAVLHISPWFAPGSEISTVNFTVDTADLMFWAVPLSKSLWGFKICVQLQVIVSSGQ